MNALIQLKKATPVFFVALVCFGLSPTARALSPAPDGGYSNFTTAEGDKALFSLTSGAGNTALGWRSLFLNTTNNFNTAIGAGALLLNTADENTATGAAALLSNTTGDLNTATGASALSGNTIGVGNTAHGANALLSNTQGNFNTANGVGSLLNNTTGAGNTATGANALFFNTTGNNNTAIGNSALTNNISDGNTAVGQGALMGNTTATLNTAIGFLALESNTTGASNTALGSAALASNTTGSGNVVVGVLSGTNIVTANSVIAIGHSGADISNTTWIGNVYGVATQNSTTAPVIVSADGQFGTAPSSERFKKDIATMDRASEVILSLRPVTFHYKTDTKDTPQFGLVAEEVAKVNPALVLPDKEGKPYTVRYDAVNAMLLNEFLKEHDEVQEQKATIAELKAELQATATRQQKQIEALTAGLQKVSAQLALSKSVPQTVKNND